MFSVKVELNIVFSVALELYKYSVSTELYI